MESLEQQSLQLGLDLNGGMHLVLEVDKEGLPSDEASDAMDRALEVIGNRINQFGVAEPSIQPLGPDRGHAGIRRAVTGLHRDVVHRAVDPAARAAVEMLGELEDTA